MLHFQLKLQLAVENTILLEKYNTILKQYKINLNN